IDLANPVFGAGSALIVVFTGIVAGSYPALYLSSFKPVKVLKSTVQVGKSAMIPRHILVVSQFIISILLISATIIVYEQIQHVKDRDLGYDSNNLIMIPATQEINSSYDALKNDLLSSGAIESLTRTSSPITDIWNYSPAPDWPGKPENTNMLVSALRVGKDFTQTLGIKVTEGHDFTGKPIDSSSVMINKAAAALMNMKDPVGTEVTYGPNARKYTIIGITENVVMSSPFKPVDPMVIFPEDGRGSFITLRLKRNIRPQQGIAVLQKVFQNYDPSAPFDYQFVDKEFGKKFASEELISSLTNIFAGLAIFICCLGLAGLASFTIEFRMKEIGIRKVLGASIQQVLLLISRDFIKLVGIAFIIAVPLTWYLLNNWLQKYEYRIEISLWMFAVVGVFLLLLTLIVVSANIMKAAIRNPIKSLRSE
ncbi:MAG: FtsX-like permease family protein, partial [Gillisia sp.]